MKTFVAENLNLNYRRKSIFSLCFLFGWTVSDRALTRAIPEGPAIATT